MSRENRNLLRAAAWLVHPDSPRAVTEISPGELAEVGRKLCSQKVSMLHVEKLHGEAVRGTALEPLIDEDRRHFRRERDEYEGIRLAFAGDGVESMLFKSAGLVPSFHYLSSNLDVIVRDGQAGRARRHLVARGYVELLNVEEPRKFLFRRFAGTENVFAFHLHEQVGWGVPFLDNRVLWEGARRPADDPAIQIPGAREALCITLAHWFYEDKELNLGNLFLTHNARRELEGPLEGAAALAAARGWEEGFWCALAVYRRAWQGLYDEDPLGADRSRETDHALLRFGLARRNTVDRAVFSGASPAVVPFIRNKWIYYRKVLRDPERPALTRVGDVLKTALWALRWKLHLRPQRGMIVSLSGCDGSGKTLQARGLARALSTCDVRHGVLWTRGASSGFMGAAISFGRALTGSRPRRSRSRGEAGGEGDDRSGARAAGEEARNAARRDDVNNPIARFLFSVVYALDLSWAFCIRARWALLAGRVVVYDRYVYDALCDYAVMTGTDASAPPVALRWLAWWAPRPRVRALLDVEPNEALRRKPEEGSTGHLECARAAFAAIARRHGLKVYAADASAEEISTTLTRDVLKAFYGRFPTVGNALLWSNPSQLNRPHRNRPS